jgi:Gpi18-like mannosyltransferase
MIIYNTIFWGQIDGMVACVLFAAFLFSFYGHLFWGCLFFMLAINLKLQAAIFLPIIAILNFKTVVENVDFKRFLEIFFALLIIQFLIILPFYITNDLQLLKSVIKNSFGKYPFLSYAAFNFWFLVKDVNTYTASIMPDSLLFLGISLNRWGFLIFCFTSFFALYHLLKQVFLFVFKKAALHFSLEKTLISSALVPLLFFFFNTQMHERYSHPCFIFLVSYAVLYKKFTPYVLASFAYFLSLESVSHFNNLGIYDTILFKNKFIACLYLVSIIYLFVQLFDWALLIKKRKEI